MDYLKTKWIKTEYTLTSEAIGNGPDGWMFAPPRQDHIASILSQLLDSLLSVIFEHRDPKKRWTNLDAAQDGIYLLGNLEHMVSF